MTIAKLIFAGLLVFSTVVQAAESGTTLPLADPIAVSQQLIQKLPDPIQSLLQYARSNEGVAYRPGGTSPESGFDCSGFVRNVYDHVAGVILPHGSKAMSQLGDKIKAAELLPGDLVFFRFMNHTISHVGIYLGNNQFIHASSTESGSVMISNLNNDYWSKHFTLARRLIIHALPTDTFRSTALSRDKDKSLSLQAF